MKHRYMLLLGALLFAMHLMPLCRPACADSRAPRRVDMSLNGDWDFFYTDSIKWAKDAKVPELPAKEDYSGHMPVPGYWDDNMDALRWTPFWERADFSAYRSLVFPMGINPPNTSLPTLIGIGFYRKTVDIPSDWKDRVVSLQVGGARMYAWVWVNGELAGEYAVFNLPFALRIDKLLKPGATNEIVIAVTNIYGSKGGLASAGYQGVTAGIYRPVSLSASGRARISDCYIYPKDDNKKLVWNVEVDGDAASASLDWRIIDSSGRTVAGGSTPVAGRNTLWNSETGAVQPWSDVSPNLYKVEVALKSRGEMLDSITQDFGLRTIVREGIGLKLNGRPILLRGLCDHYCFPMTCTAPLDIESYRHNIRKYKQLGFNWIRCHTWIPSEEYMQAADELGITFQVEGTSAFTDQDWIDTIRVCRKHPSVVIYCCGNENLLDEKMIDYCRSVAGLCRAFAPDSLFDPMECLNGVDNWYGEAESNRGKAYTEKPFPHNPERLELLKQFSDVLAPNNGLSYNCSNGDWKALDERYAQYQRPLLVHEMGIIGNYLNLDLEHRFEGTRVGTNLYSATRQYLEKCGVLKNAPKYFYNSCQWTRIVRKFNMETGRKTRAISGYDFLGAIDQNWNRAGYPCGIMNEFYEMKPGESADDVLKDNGESVILLDCRRERNLAAGKRCSYDMSSSLYGSGPLSRGTLSWISRMTMELSTRGAPPRFRMCLTAL